MKGRIRWQRHCWLHERMHALSASLLTTWKDACAVGITIDCIKWSLLNWRHNWLYERTHALTASLLTTWKDAWTVGLTIDYMKGRIRCRRHYWLPERKLTQLASQLKVWKDAWADSVTIDYMKGLMRCRRHYWLRERTYVLPVSLLTALKDACAVGVTIDCAWKDAGAVGVPLHISCPRVIFDDGNYEKFLWFQFHNHFFGSKLKIQLEPSANSSAWSEDQSKMLALNQVYDPIARNMNFYHDLKKIVNQKEYTIFIINKLHGLLSFKRLHTEKNLHLWDHKFANSD